MFFFLTDRRFTNWASLANLEPLVNAFLVQPMKTGQRAHNVIGRHVLHAHGTLVLVYGFVQTHLGQRVNLTLFGACLVVFEIKQCF